MNDDDAAAPLAGSASISVVAPPVSDADIRQWLVQARDGQRRGNLHQAQAPCRRILAVRPRHTEALNLLGMLQLDQGQPALAEQTFRQAIHSALGNAAGYANLGATLVAQHRYEEAVTAFSQAIRLRADDPEVHIQLGDTLRELNRLPEAVDAWQQASALRPTDPELHYRLGVTLAELGRPDQAIAALDITRQANPDQEAAIRLLVTLLHGQSRIAEAGEIVGSAARRWGITAPAQALLQHWLTLSPDDPVAQHFLTAWFSPETPARAADAYVTRLFDQYAEQFDEDLRALDYQAPELLAEAVAAVLEAPAQTLEILDAGCGTGLCGPLLRPYARQLIGVDLSAGMIEKAHERGGYDELTVAELTAFLREHPAHYDLIVSADTLVYFGDLGLVLTAAAAALRPDGWLAFTVEQATAETAPAGFCLNRSGRYSHTADYVQQILVGTGLRPASLTPVRLRMEHDRPVVGWRVLAQQPALPISGNPS